MSFRKSIAAASVAACFTMPAYGGLLTNLVGGLTGLLADTASAVSSNLSSALSSLGTSSLVDADALAPATGSGLIDADVASSQTLLGLEPLIDGSLLSVGNILNGVGNTTEAVATPLNSLLQGLLGPEGAVPGLLQNVGNGLQTAIVPVTDALALTGLEDLTADIELINLSLGSLDIGSNTEQTVLDVDILNTDTGSYGDIGLALISDGASGTGEVAGISILGGDYSGSGGSIGVSVLGGDNSGTGELLGLGVISGDGSGVSDTIGVGVLTGDNSGQGDLLGAGIISGDESGLSELIGLAALTGSDSGTGALISTNVLTSVGEETTGSDYDDPSNPGVDQDGDTSPLEELFFQLAATDAALYAMSCDGQDSDGDGVCDEDDRCPDTPEGAAVLTSGCHLGGDAPLVLYGVQFAYDSSQLTQASARELYHAIQVLKQNPGLYIEVAGHTDDRGTDDYNQVLSIARAFAVHDVLTRNGVDANRLLVEGYGRSRPIAPNTRPEGGMDLAGMAENRRVEFSIVNRQYAMRDN